MQAAGLAPMRESDINGEFVGQPIFSYPESHARHKLWSSLAASIMLHLSLGLGLVALGNHLDRPDPERQWQQRFVRRHVQIRIPPELFISHFQPDPPKLRRPASPSHAGEDRRPMAKQPSDAVQASAEPSAHPGDRPVRQFQLPPATHKRDIEQVVLMPNAPAELQPDTRLPNLVFWSDAKVRRWSKPFVQPGAERRVVEPRVLEAPPSVSGPNNQDAIADLKMTGTESVKAAINRVVSSTNPVKAFTPPAARARTQFETDLFPGDAVNVLTINSQSASLESAASISRFNQIPDIAGPSRASSADAAGAADRTKRAGSDQLAGAGKGAPTNAGGLGAGAGFNIEGKTPIRVVHPENGTFAFVIVQASDMFPESAGLLKGNPIQTVYLKIGTPKDWILQYCVNGEGLQTAGSVVQLGNPAPVKAPYPRITVAPPAGVLPSGRTIILHGFLTKAGQFRAMRAVRTEDKEAEIELQQYLQHWEFRPAVRDLQPVEVELVLLIPSAD